MGSTRSAGIGAILIAAAMGAGCIGTTAEDEAGRVTGNLDVHGASLEGEVGGAVLDGRALAAQGWCHADGFRVRTVAEAGDRVAMLKLRVADADVRLDAAGIVDAVRYDGWSATFTEAYGEEAEPGVLSTTSDQAGADAQVMLEAHVGPREGEWDFDAAAEQVTLTVEPTSARRRLLYYEADFTDGQRADGQVEIEMPQSD